MHRLCDALQGRLDLWVLDHVETGDSRDNKVFRVPSDRQDFLGHLAHQDSPELPDILVRLFVTANVVSYYDQSHRRHQHLQQND